MLYLLSIVESTESKQVYVGKLDFVSERTIKDIIIIIAFTISGITDIIAISDISTTTQLRWRRGGGILNPFDVFLC